MGDIVAKGQSFWERPGHGNNHRWHKLETWHHQLLSGFE
jgi:hypothetical protein